MNMLKDFLGIKSPSAEAAKHYELIREVIIEPFLEGVRIGMTQRNCRCVMVYPECDIEDSPKYWDVKASPVFEDISLERHQMRKWLSQIPHGGIVGDKAVLIVYNSEAPELSEMIVGGI
jgi:hypothetical protein